MRWELRSHLMTSCVMNISTKNYRNLITGFQVTIENAFDVFCDTVYVYTDVHRCTVYEAEAAS